MEKIHGNMHVFMLSSKFLTSKHKNMHVCVFAPFSAHLYPPCMFVLQYNTRGRGLGIIRVAEVWE